MNRVNAAKFVAKEMHSKGLAPSNPLVLEVMENCIEAAEILTKYEVKVMIEDALWFYGSKLYKKEV